MSIPASRWRRALASVVLLAFVSTAGACGAAPPRVGEVSAEQVAASLGSEQAPLLLDVRTPEEFASGHVPGAINIPQDQLAARTGELGAQREREVVVYCEKGPRANRAASVLAAAGFTAVRLLAGHMSGWRAAGLPVQ